MTRKAWEIRHRTDTTTVTAVAVAAEEPSNTMGSALPVKDKAQVVIPMVNTTGLVVVADTVQLWRAMGSAPDVKGSPHKRCGVRHWQAMKCREELY